MKFKTVKSKDATSGIAQVVGAGVGFMLPDVILNTALSIKDESLITDSQKNQKMYGNALLLVAGGYLTLAVDGNDATSEMVRALGLGLAGGSARNVAKHFLAKPVANMTDGAAKTMLATGLGCACTENKPTGLYRPALRMPSRLASPIETMEERTIDLANFSNAGDLAYTM